MPPETTATTNTPQSAPESLSQTIEAPAETPAPEPAQAIPEAVPVPTEPVPAPETNQPTTPMAQIPSNEPMAPEPEPFDFAQDKPTAPEPVAPQPEPPSAAASAPTPIIPPPTGILHTARDILNKARVTIQDRKRKKRDKIMAALNAKTKITNNEVEKLLHVSDATATRYLSALEKEGKIIQVGKQGKGIVYIKTP